MDVPVLSQVLEALKRIGKNTDAAGVASVFGRLPRVDKSACIPFGTPNGNINATSAYQTIQSITGKAGFLDFVILAGSAQNSVLKITVDNVVTFEGKAAGATFFTGVIQRQLILVNAGNMVIPNPAAIYQFMTVEQNAAHFFGYPYTANGSNTQTLSIISDSIYFNSSLLVEARVEGTPSALGYYLAGGYRP